MSNTKTVEAGEQKRTPGTMNADDVLEMFGIRVEGERLSDESCVWNVRTSEAEINCLSARHADKLAMDIAVAIRNATAL